MAYLFQCFFYSAIIYSFFLITGLVSVSHVQAFQVFYLYYSGGWFVVAYLGLYILAPILNAYIEKVSLRQLAITVLLFYIFQTIFGCMGHYNFFNLGYSTLSFIGLYMLAQLVRKSHVVLPPHFQLFRWNTYNDDFTVHKYFVEWIRSHIHSRGILFSFYCT